MEQLQYTSEQLLFVSLTKHKAKWVERTRVQSKANVCELEANITHERISAFQEHARVFCTDDRFQETKNTTEHGFKNTKSRKSHSHFTLLYRRRKHQTFASHNHPTGSFQIIMRNQKLCGSSAEN